MSFERHEADNMLERLADCTSLDEVRAAGFLFHGTCEDISGPLRGGAYDNVFWAAETPGVAQAYIPRAGMTRYVARPSSFEREDRVRPVQGTDMIQTWALARAGCSLEDLDVEWNHGRAVSWRIPEGWPRRSDIEDWLVSLGYRPNANDVFEVSTRFRDGVEEAMPADWKLQGQLLILDASELKIETPTWSEEALGYKTHNRVGDFARFAEEGIEAFAMSDLLQSDVFGNLPHRAIGILPAGLEKLSWIALPAVRFDPEDVPVFQGRSTPEFDRLMRDLRGDWGDALDAGPPEGHLVGVDGP